MLVVVEVSLELVWFGVDDLASESIPFFFFFREVPQVPSGF